MGVCAAGRAEQEQEKETGRGWEADPQDGEKDLFMGKKMETRTYDDIIDLPHYVSPTRPRMSMLERAAQFCPFDPLAGFDEELMETARQLEERMEQEGKMAGEIDEYLPD